MPIPNKLLLIRLFVKVSIPDTGKGKKQGTLSKKYPLYGKSRTDDVMKTPS